MFKCSPQEQQAAHKAGGKIKKHIYLTVVKRKGKETDAAQRHT